MNEKVVEGTDIVVWLDIIPKYLYLLALFFFLYALIVSNEELQSGVMMLCAVCVLVAIAIETLIPILYSKVLYFSLQ